MCLGQEDMADLRTPLRDHPDTTAPLEQAMILLWVVGLSHLGQRLVIGEVVGLWPSTAGLATLTGSLLIGHFHLFRWAALPMLLGLAGLSVGLDRGGWTARHQPVHPGTGGQ